MAIFQLTIALRDAFTRRTSKRFDLEAADHATAMTNAAAFLVEFEDVTGAEVLKYSVAEAVDGADTPTALSNVDAGITIACDLGSGKSASLKIPAPEMGFIDPDGTVDMTDIAITSLETFFTDGKVLISDGETVVDFLSGKLDK